MSYRHCYGFMRSGGLAIALLFSVFSLYGQLPQEGEFTGFIRTLMDKRVMALNPRKVYLHFDRDSYRGGETIWFKAYLFDGVDHSPASGRYNLFIGLAGSDGRIEDKMVISVDDGVGFGSLNLSDSIPDGNYCIYAYTDNMINAGDRYFFSKYLYIENPFWADIIPRNGITANRRFNRDLESRAGQFEIGFFPEGGNLVAGRETRVSFRAFDGNGKGVNVSGEVVNSRNETIVQFASDSYGIGSLVMTVDPGESYRAVVSFDNRRPVSHPFPSHSLSGHSLRIDQTAGGLLLSILPETADREGPDGDVVYLVAHTRGVVHYSEKLETGSREIVQRVPKEIFPTGIAHFTMFSAAREILAERLVYIDHGDRLFFDPRIYVSRIDDVDYYVIMVNSIDNDGNPVPGNFSISVVSGEFTPPGTERNLVGYLNFDSDLGTVTENRQLFMTDADDDPRIDNIMISGHMPNFYWPAILHGRLPEAISEPAYGVKVSGRLYDQRSGSGLPGHAVTMRVVGGPEDVYRATTDGQGRFEFTGLDYHDVFMVRIEGSPLAGTMPGVELDQKTAGKRPYEAGFYTRPEEITERGRNWSAPRRSRVSSDTPGRSPSLYGQPNQSIPVDDRMIHSRSLLEVLTERGRGLIISGGQVMFRGPSTILGSNEPIFILDGIELGKDSFLNLDPKDIERVDLFSGASSSAFGVRGANGAIVAYSRKAVAHSVQANEFLVRGFDSSREFIIDIDPPAGLFNDPGTPARTVLWEPDLTTGEDGRAMVAFPVVSGLGEIKIVIEGAGADGRPGSGAFTVETGR